MGCAQADAFFKDGLVNERPVCAQLGVGFWRDGVVLEGEPARAARPARDGDEAVWCLRIAQEHALKRAVSSGDVSVDDGFVGALEGVMMFGRHGEAVEDADHDRVVGSGSRSSGPA